MIATRPKDFNEILKTLSQANRIFIVGCGDCATVLQTGGEHEVEEIKHQLEANGKTITGTVIPPVTCQVLDTKRLLRQHKEAVDASDAILVMACGAGIQAVAEARDDKPAVAGLDTTFSANKMRAGQFYEWCSMCGECVVDKYGGVCPITRCPKGQKNGPCGGADRNGKCEVNPGQDCVWTLILKRSEKLRDNGTLKHSIEDDIAEPQNYGQATHPREYIFKPRRA